MKQKTYRRIRRSLYLLMAVVFILLYLLIRDERGGKVQTGDGWDGTRNRALGTVMVSDVHSGGFIVDEFPFAGVTNPGDDDFSSKVLTCNAVIHNEGTTTVRVRVDLYGTDFQDGKEINPGLSTVCYQYSGTQDPAAGDYGGFLSGLTPEKCGMTLYRADGSDQLILQPGESRTLALYFWVDEHWNPATSYSITVKLMSRAL